MKKIDDYVDNIYKNFDETYEDTKILIEETKYHLYEEVEELKRQGLSENESIEKAISNFGQENIVIDEMNTVLKKQNKFSKILIKVALMIYLIGCIFKIINFASEFLPEKDTFLPSKLNSDYLLETIQDKINDKDSIDENIKDEITILLDEFNNETNNGLYYIGIEKSGEYYYEYSKNISEASIKINKNSGQRGNQSGWNIHYKHTDIQGYYDHAQTEEEFNNRFNSMPYRLNELSNYLFIISWILVCVSLINKAYIRNLSSKKYIAFFVCSSILILGLFITGKHTLEESMIILTGIMMLISKFYSKYYFHKKLN
ncbi:permease prefix domain 1-containing protein [Clostridium beijerinckii]|uniref:permease prefix domain 1-containing protein n=1 Tax=Clostridium beijerinckii TaxID=1520 RepID=UPI00080A05DE|nr:permease prefix domain 1-containing protein [Clostridium beijerinckii]OCA98334.1 hypothetical protein BGS1_23165 [Clostridium beijerinckii]